MNISVKFKKLVPGHLFGLRSGGMLIDLHQPIDSEYSLRSVAKQLMHGFALALQRAALGIFEPGRILAVDTENGRDKRVRLIVPVQLWMATAGLDLFNAVLHSQLNQPIDWEKSVDIDLAIQSFKQAGPQSSNTPRLIQAASELDIPVLPIGSGVFQIGHGSSARWLQSTCTDKTGSLSMRMARDKVWAALMLREAGLPVPDHRLVDSEQTAVAGGRQLGFPVVIKPADKDGGVGVFSSLETEVELIQAYHASRKHSQRVLVEKHVFGQDYRLTVLHGQLLWAIQRVPAGVTGDGVLTVSQLVKQCNSQPTRGTGPHAVLKKIEVNDEATQLLHRQGLGLNSIPASGQFVALRRAANVASGGMPVKVTELVHPDNAALAIRAAQVLRLDLAGIDLLIPDISVSWLESGGAICEINAQPQIGATTGPHLYGEILKTLIPNNGRIPIVLVLGDCESARISDAADLQLRSLGLRVGLVSSGEFRINGRLAGRAGLFQASNALLRDPDVDCLLVKLSDLSILQTGLPFDRYDCLIVQSTKLDGLENTGLRRGTLIRELMLTLLPACKRLVINVTNSGCKFEEPMTNTNAFLSNVDHTGAEFVQEAIDLMQLSLFDAARLGSSYIVKSP